MLYFCKKKRYVFANLWRFYEVANRKKFGQLIANPQRVTFAEGLQIQQIS
jgi:hypothetical protein